MKKECIYKKTLLGTEIAALHDVLLEHWDLIQNSLNTHLPSREKTCLTILEEDLNLLLIECEQVMLNESIQQVSTDHHWVGTKCATVLEEVRHLIPVS